MSKELPADVQARICKDALNAASGIGDQYRKDGVYHGYIAGATAENSRAQLLVDALEEFISYHETGLLPARHVYEKAVAKLEQWKGKEVEVEKANDKCRCIQPNWNAFTGKCLTCGKP